MSISFEIYQSGRRLTSFAVRGAHVTGPESVPASGRVVFEKGLLQVFPVPSEEDELGAAGVALLWDAGASGKFLLETTRLLPRETPYILNVELARHRLMRLVHKQEDWNLWDQPAVSEALALVAEAKLTFADALSNLNNPAEASRLADEALGKAIDASEQLATIHADMLLGRRRELGMPRTLFGVRVDPGVRNARYRGTLARFFDYSVIPLPWSQLQPEEDTFDTEAADSAVEFLARNRVPIIAGPLIDLIEGQVPEWLFIYEHDFETLRDLAFQYVKSVVTRYRRVVRVWNVVAGLHISANFGLNFEQMIELTRLMVGQVKSINRQARTLVTVRLPYGEYLAAGSQHGTGVAPMLYAEMVAQSGVECDGFGLEIKTGVPAPGMYCRDLFQISAMLDRFALLGKPVFVTAVACPDRDHVAGAGDPSEGGRWHEPWSPQLQAKWLRDVYQVALSKPYVENIAWADLSDFESARTMLPGSGLLDDMLQPKPAFEALQGLRRTFRPPAPVEAPTA